MVKQLVAMTAVAGAGNKTVVTRMPICDLFGCNAQNKKAYQPCYSWTVQCSFCNVIGFFVLPAK